METADDDGQHGGVPGGMGSMRGHGAQAFYIALAVVSLIVSAVKLLKKGVTATLKQALKQIKRLFTKKFRNELAKKFGINAAKKAIKKYAKRVAKFFSRRTWNRFKVRAAVNWRKFANTRFARFFWDGRTYHSIRADYTKLHGAANGWELHHWLLGRNEVTSGRIMRGFRNAGFNLINLPGKWNGFVDFNYRLGSGMWMVSRGAKNLIRVVIPFSLVGGASIGASVGGWTDRHLIHPPAGAPPNPRKP
jgi:hypothetical protein